MTIRDINWVNGPSPVIDPDYLGNIFASTSDLAFLVTAEGTIMSTLVDEGARHHKLIAHWGGKQIRQFLTSESVPKFDQALSAILNGVPVTRRIELNHSDGTDWQLPVRYTFHAVGPGDSVLMLGHDLRFEAETQEQLILAQIALEQGFEDKRRLDAWYRVVLSSTTEPFLFVSALDGRIQDLNSAAAAFLGKSRDELLGAVLTQIFSDVEGSAIIEALSSLAQSDGEGMLAVKTLKGARMVDLEPTLFRTAGERMIFCRIVTSENVADQGERLTADLSSLFDQGPEAIVFTSVDGIVREMNDAFLELAGVPGLSDAKHKSLGAFLHRGHIDLSVILKHVRQTGRLRMYSTRLKNELGKTSLVNMSATLLGEGDRQIIGFVMRDAERADVIHRGTQPANQSAAPNQNVAELVGTATLREIVSEANEVIEKMCIETAVELTDHNRAAAAEMLGMSRQSLYVKLRKYGLQDRSVNE